MAGSFKLPKVVLKGKKDFELPRFSWDTITKTKKLGSGSFGSVYLATHGSNSQSVVVKKLKNTSIDSQTRFIKEARILNSVKGHRNVSSFFGFCSEPYSVMMQYSSFDFGFFGAEKTVSSLADFLQFIDVECEFASFANLLPVCVKDILTGLDYLHNKNIAHRDLKPSNILVCNQHLKDVAHDEIAMGKAYEQCPIVCRLTDFGLSRGIDLQTKSVTMSKTTSMYCGTPAYMAPEMQLNQLDFASLDDLKRSDMWSLGLVVHTMMNPELGSPYQAEIEQTGVLDVKEAVKKLLVERRLPQHGTKYQQLRVTWWWQLEEVFDQCANFDAMARPSPAKMLCIFRKSLLDCFHCLPLTISQTTILDQYDAFFAANLGGNELQPAPELTSPPNDATNACAFLSLGICDRLLNNAQFLEQPDWEHVREVVEDVILKLPSHVNSHRDATKLYDIEEAQSILARNNLLSEEYELLEECVSVMSKVFSTAGREEIVKSLASKASQGKAYMGAYTVSPYIFTIGVCKNALFLVDTHPVNEELGGNGNGVLMVTPDCSYESCRSVVQWLLQRLTMAGVKGNPKQSLVWLKPLQGKEKGITEEMTCRGANSENSCEIIDELTTNDERNRQSQDLYTADNCSDGQEYIEERGFQKKRKKLLETDGLEIVCVKPGVEDVGLIFVKEERRSRSKSSSPVQDQVQEDSLEENANKTVDGTCESLILSTSVGSSEDENDDSYDVGITAPQLYGDDPALPVYRWGLSKGVSTDEIATILLGGNVDEARVATKVPTNVSKNTSFIIDTTKLHHDQDVKCDDLGAWHYTGTKKFGYSLDDTGAVHREDDLADNPQYQLSRQFFKNKSLPSLRKIIIMARNMISSVPEDLCFIQYIFEEGEQEVHVKAHGNSKKSFGKTGYKRTMKSTKDLIAEKLLQFPPREASHEIIKERGGIQNIRQSGEFPRNRNQVYNVNRRLKIQKSNTTVPSHDPLLQVVTKAKEDQKGRVENAFIREIPLFPEPIVFLASEQQLRDIERFCTNPAKFCVVGVDATFQIAGFYFTFTTYRNLMLTTEKGHHPVFIGPGILHKQKLYTSYKTLPLLMSKYCHGTSGILVYGTDGEENMAKAFSDAYPNAKHLRCDIHMRDNVKRKLSEIGISGAVAAEIMYDIFGKKLDGGIEGGLVDCTSSQEFDTALTAMVEKWNTLHNHGGKFVEYFLKEKADVIREAARADIRSVCGLGYPPKVYTQNANECMNRLIKAQENSSYSKKESSMLPYVERVRNEIKRQQDEQFLAVIGRGQYRLTEEFSFLQVKEHNFYSMTDGQKTSLRRNFFSIKVTETPNARTKPPEEMKTLSISPEESGIIDVPFPILTGIFDKAATLVNNHSHIWKMPTKDTQDKPAFMVHSTSSEYPHRVMVCPNGKVMCDKACLNWSTYTLCSHTIAVAETVEHLKEFLEWFKRQKRVPNLTTITNFNMPQNKGRKSGTRKRKGAANTTPTEGLPVVSSRVVQSQAHQQPHANIRPMFPSNSLSHNAVTTTSVAIHREVTFTSVPSFRPSIIPSSVSRLSSVTSPSVPFQPTMSSSSNVSFHPSMVPSSVPFQPAMASPSRVSLQPGITSSSVPFHLGVPATSVTFQAGMASPVSAVAEQAIDFQLARNTQPPYPARPKPSPGEFTFGRLPFLDNRVSRCYGCGDQLKPTPSPPHDLVLITRLHRKYTKDGVEQVSPCVSSVYIHVNQYCARNSLPEFTPASCFLPNDLIPYLHQEHYDLIYAKLGINFQQIN